MSVCEVIECSSARDLLDQLSSRNHRFARRHRDDWVFRGQASSIWDLRPTAFRDPHKLLVNVDAPWADWDNQIQMAAEADTLATFVTEADRAGLPIPGDLRQTYTCLYQPHNPGVVTRGGDVFEWPPPAVWAVVALAQHYGIATRFLDWTRSAAAACYFAAIDVLRKSLKGQLAVWAFSTSFTQSAAALQAGSRKRVVVATAPYSSNPNLLAQQGVHIALSIQNPLMNASADRDDIGEHLTKIDQASRVHGHTALLKFTLPCSVADHLLWYLSKDGVTAARLFPGYGGAARAVLERKWHANDE